MPSALARLRCPSLSVAAFACLSGCAVDTGVVELSWMFTDRDGERIFPGGQFELDKRSACNLAGRLDGSNVDVDLEIEVSICDPACAGGCGDAACQVVDPLRYGCTTFRGSDPDVPASDEPYRFTVGAVIVSDQADLRCSDPSPGCIAVPGPRDRSVTPGLVTDLQVYQIAVDIDLDDDEVLDLEACGCA